MDVDVLPAFALPGPLSGADHAAAGLADDRGADDGRAPVPCLGLALAFSGALWLGIGSTIVAFVL